MTIDEILTALRQASTPDNLEGMKRFGIDTANAIGVSIPPIRALAKKIKKNHQLALELWKTNIHEARILASLVDDPKLVTEAQIDEWVQDFNSWDICDQVCGNLFDRTPYVIAQIKEFSARKEEYVKRAGFTLIAEFAMHNKAAADEVFMEFFPIIEREAWDDRNFVKKAVNWALRQTGKRNAALHKEAILCAKRILLQESKAAKWIAKNALAELEARSPKGK
jgi:3-methyladenine DNA glycosylase AlkD